MEIKELSNASKTKVFKEIEKERKRKRRVRFLRVFLFLLPLILVIIFLSSKYAHINSVVIINNDYVKISEINFLTNLDTNDNFYLTSMNEVKKNIMKNPFVKKVEIKRSFFQKIEINITEYKVVAQDIKTQDVLLESGSIVKGVGPNSKVANFSVVDGMDIVKLSTFLKEINEITYAKISEIVYMPNNIHKDRYLLYMNDGNQIYTTTNDSFKVNKYEELLHELNLNSLGVHGVFNIDSGDVFIPY